MNSPKLFEEIKKASKETNSNLTSVVDDIHGAKNITDNFRNIYENLYNEQDDIDRSFFEKINDKVAEMLLKLGTSLPYLLLTLLKLLLRS